MTRIISAVLLMVALASAESLARVPSACGVDLRIELRRSPVSATAGFVLADVFDIRLMNIGPTSVTLVMPGDGSGFGWRTPIVTWSVEADGAVNPPRMVRCGNINALRTDEVFTLAPGESHRIDQWVPPIPIDRPGTYRVALRFVNDPSLSWQGEPLGTHNERAMAQVRASTPCDVTSNTVTITVP